VIVVAVAAFVLVSRHRDAAFSTNAVSSAASSLAASK
jgi:hypothetical protein